jgi:hypothetical protein
VMIELENIIKKISPPASLAEGESLITTEK